MKKSAIALLSLILITFFNVVHAQTLNEVLNEYFKAVGQEKLNTVKSFYMKAKVSQMGMEMPMEMKVKKPDLFIATVEFQGQKIITAFDGEKGWMINPMVGTEPQELAGDQLKQAREQTDIEGELYNYEKKGHTAELIGKVTIEGKELYRVKLTTKDGNTKDYFIDASTYLLNRIKAKVNSMGQTVDVEQIMSEYKSFDGIMQPMKIEQKNPMGTGTVTVEVVKYNENYDDSIFKKPSK